MLGTLTRTLFGCSAEDFESLFHGFESFGILEATLKRVQPLDAERLWDECVWESFNQAFPCVPPYEARFDWQSPEVSMDMDDLRDIEDAEARMQTFFALSGLRIKVKEVAR